jgi:hypothetical protein
MPIFERPGKRPESMGPGINRRRDEALPLGKAGNGLAR